MLTFQPFDFLIRILGILAGAVLVSWLISVFSGRLLEAMMRIHGMKERDRRVRTIGRVLHSTGYALITLVALVMILRELHIDPSPIIASAGIAGLAVSFGAQSLIKDVFAGICILMEDQFCVGDEVKLDDVSGTVKELTLRKSVIVDAEGNHTHVPHGQVRIVRVESRKK